MRYDWKLQNKKINRTWGKLNLVYFISFEIEKTFVYINKWWMEGQSAVSHIIVFVFMTVTRLYMWCNVLSFDELVLWETVQFPIVTMFLLSPWVEDAQDKYSEAHDALGVPPLQVGGCQDWFLCVDNHHGCLVLYLQGGRWGGRNLLEDAQ